MSILTNQEREGLEDVFLSINTNSTNIVDEFIKEAKVWLKEAQIYLFSSFIVIKKSFLSK